MASLPQTSRPRRLLAFACSTASASVGRTPHRSDTVPFRQALCQRRFRSRRGDEEDFVEGVLAHAGHGALVLLLLFRSQSGLQCGKERLRAFLFRQADHGAHMAYFRHIEDAQKGCSLLRSTAGVEDDEGLLGQDADAAAVLHSGKARQNGSSGISKPLRQRASASSTATAALPAA